jgi:hypothetical protein
MAGNDCIPLFEDADRLTVQCVEAVKGKRFITAVENFLSGPGMPAAPQVGASDPVDGSNIMAAHCPAGAKALGVSTWDEEEGGKTGCITEGVVPVTAGANIIAGAIVAVGAEGKAVNSAAEGTAAVIETGVVANNNRIRWTQVKPGAAAVKVILKVAGNNTPLSVKVAGEVITVEVATDGAAKAISTAAQVIEAVNKSAEASAKVLAANGGASTGAGVVVAVTEAEGTLAGGTSPTADCGIAVSGALNGEDVYVKLHC